MDDLTNTQVTQSSVVRAVQREIGTALYREYLRRGAAGGQRVTSRDFEKPKGAEPPMLKVPFGGIPPKGTAVEGVLVYAKMRKGQ